MDFSGRHYPKDLILQSVRWYLRYSLSYRDLEEILEERGVKIDYTTPYRWVQEYAPLLEAEHRKRRKSCGTSWRMDETYIKVKGKWVYLYRAVDTEVNTVDFLLTKKRDKKAALRFFRKAIRLNGMPEKVTIDKSGSNTAALKDLNEELDKAGKPRMVIRQIKYLYNLVEQDHQGIKRRTTPMLGFQSFKTARRTLKGIELCRMIRKGQYDKTESANDWEYFGGPLLSTLEARGHSYPVKVSMKNLTKLLIKQSWEPIVGRPDWKAANSSTSVEAGQKVVVLLLFDKRKFALQ